MGNENSQQVSYGTEIQNDVRVTWRRTVEGGAAGREGHCAAAVGTSLYIFGGVVSDKGQELVESNDLFVYDTESGAVSHVSVTGDVPAPRTASTLAAVGTSLYLFGGLSRETGWFDDFHVFNTEKKSWSLVEVEGDAPSARDKLASTVVGRNIYIFGGFGPQEDDDDCSTEDEDLLPEQQQQSGAQFGWFNDLYMFDTEIQKWSNPLQMNACGPSPRAAHSMCTVEKYIVIFGGRTSEARQNDLHIFDTGSRKWVTDATVSGKQPAPRSFHSATAVQSRVIVTGGRDIANHHLNDVHIFDTKTHEWLQPAVTGDVPAARGLHTTTVVGDKLVLFGGSSDLDAETMQCKTYHSDVHAIAVGDLVKGGPTMPSMEENQENMAAVANVDSSKEEGLHRANQRLDSMNSH